VNIVYFGTPDFSARILSYLLEHDIHVLAVVSKPDKPKGRSRRLIPTPVKEVAERRGIPLYQPDRASDPGLDKTLSALSPDLFVVVAYGEILKQQLLEIPRVACINLHTSLLPKYRGAAPIQHAVIAGEKETGATVMHMTKKMDAGDIIKQKKVLIDQQDTFGEVQDKLLAIGAPLLYESIIDFSKGIENRIVQDESLVSFAPKIELEDCEINWRQPAEKIYNLVRGVNPYPGAWTRVDMQGEIKRIKIYTCTIQEELSIEPGKCIITNKNRLYVGTATEALEIIELQLEGKKRMSAGDLLRGMKIDMMRINWEDTK